MKKQVWNYLIDALLLVGFLVAFFLDLTGLDGHQLLGVFVAVFSGYHLVLHWDWVKAVSIKLFKKTAPRPRTYYILDAILLGGLFLITITGFVISTWANLELVNYFLWVDFHILSSVATLAALILKIGLHWKWIVNTTRRIFPKPSPVVNAPRQPRLQPTPAVVEIGRREFISLMGVVGVASIIAASNGIKSITSQQIESTSANQTNPSVPSSPSTSKTTSSTRSSSSSSSSSTTCRIRCNKGCSYPGRCKRYTDSNNNKKCDLGECL